MKKSILLILSFFLAVTLYAQDISSVLRQAQARFESGNEAGGIELVNKVLAKYPDNQEAKNLLAKFNQTIKDREIDADWKTAQTQNTFESYQQFRTKHPNSKYDDIASDNMAKKLADKFNVNSTYADRTKAESYAKKSMTKDYIANKWKAAMAKKTTSTSSSSSSSSSYGSSNTSSSTSTRSYNSSSSTSSSRYGSSYGSSYSSSSSSSYGGRSYNSYNTIPHKSKFAIGIEGSVEGLNSVSTGWGLSMRIGAFNSLFNMTIGAKYQHQGYALEALNCVLEEYLINRRLYMIEAKYNETNIASKNLLQKLGFHIDGILRERRIDFASGKRTNLVICSLTSEELYKNS